LKGTFTSFFKDKKSRSRRPNIGINYSLERRGDTFCTNDRNREAQEILKRRGVNTGQVSEWLEIY
jgi:hypothetical protein